MTRGDDPTVASPSTAPEEDPGAISVHGQLAGRWEIHGLIGTGGMGNVYRAYDGELGEMVALKVLRRNAGPDAAAALERFRHEVKLARRVTHVNVARTHDLGRHGETLFLTMEVIDGEPLSHRIARGPIPWRETLAIARGIAAGVGAAHAAGVVHRDLKPDNVMLARDGRVVVTDFGIAATTAMSRGDQTVEVTGTPAWMAPEQLTGTSSSASDVYALGEIVWMMLLGVHPWLTGGVLQILPRLTEPPPRMPRGDIPEAFAAAIEVCLLREPARRFLDAIELGHALAEADDVTSTGAASLRQAAPAGATPDIRVEVEPVRNLGDPANEYLAAGLVEDLIDVLSRTRGIRVRAASAERDRERDPVDIVVSGSLRCSGAQIRINVRVAGARDGFQIWSKRFDVGLDEILQVSDQIARDVTVALSVTAASSGAGRDVATDPVVVELYLRARQLDESFWLGDARPLTLYQAALERDPTSPVVLAAYARVLARRSGAEDSVAEGSEAEVMARRAIAHGPGLPEPWVAIAAVFYNQNRNLHAMRAVRLGLERGPALPEAAEAAGRMLLELDPSLDEAPALLERAHWANPKSPTNLLDRVRGHALRGDWDQVEACFQSSGVPESARMLARMRMSLWNPDLSAEFPLDVPGLARIRWLLEVLAEARRSGVSEALLDRWCDRLFKLPPRSRLRRLFAQLGVESMLRFAGPEQAWPFLDDAVTNGLLDLAWMERLTLLEPMRRDPRFGAARAVVAARAAPVLAIWRGPLPDADIDGWPAV